MKRLWIPLIVLLVVAAGAFTVSRLHSIFGSEKLPTYGDTQNTAAPTAAAKPKQLTYEVSGPPGTVADIAYFDVNGNPKFVKNASLPWSLSIDVSKATAVGNVMAQGDSDSISCRILVGDDVKATNSSTEMNGLTSCLLKAA